MLQRVSGQAYTFLTRLRSVAAYFAFKAAGDSRSWEDVLSLIGRHNEYAWPDLSVYSNQAQLYIQSPWTYIAISKIARAAALVNLNVMRADKDGKKQIDDNHPISQLLNKPNDYQSQFELMEMTVGFLQINGNAYWLLNGPEGGRPTEILVLRPDRVRIVAGTEGKLVAGYVYTVDGIEVPLMPEEVIHFRRFHPLSDYYGLSPIEAAAIDIQSDRAMSKWNHNYFAIEKAIPAGVVSIKSPLTDTEYERIQHEWQEAYGGTQRRTAFIRGAEVTFQDIGENHKDMDFATGRQFNRELIMLVFGIPPGMLDKNATEANARAGMEVFTADTIWPQMVEMAQKLTAVLCPLWGDDVTIEAEDIRTRDTKADRDEITAFAPYMDINEVRERYLNLPPVAWGDRPAAGYGAVEVTGVSLSKSGQAKPEQLALTAGDEQARTEAADDVVDSSLEQEGVKTISVTVLTRTRHKELTQFRRYAVKGKDISLFEFEASPVGFGIAMKALADIGLLDEMLAAKGILSADQRVSVGGFVDPHAKAKTKAAHAIAQASADYLSKLQDKIITAARHEVRAAKAKLPPDFPERIEGNLDDDFWDSETDDFAGELRPLIQDAVQNAALGSADMAAVQHGIPLDKAALIAAAGVYASKWVDTILAGIMKTSRDGVQAILDRWGQTNDATLEDLIQALLDSWLFGKDRATLIGESEASRTFGQGTFESAQELARTANVPMAVNQADIDSRYPAHGDCRCFLIMEFITDEDGKIQGVDMRWYTVNDAHVCPICEGRNDQLMSDIVEMNL